MYRYVRWPVFVCLAATLLWAAGARADYGAGRIAWEGGRYAEALTQWQAAARKGDRRAMVALGRAFAKGLGVPQDYVEAHKWFNLAAARGDAKAVLERDALEKRMTIEERAEARKLARAWRSTGKPKTTGIPPLWKAKRGSDPRAPRPGVGVAAGSSRPRVRAKAALRAAAAGDISALKAALAGGADPNARGKRGWTPLMYAANKGYTLLVRPLLEAGAKPNLRAADGAVHRGFARTDGDHRVADEVGCGPLDQGTEGQNIRGGGADEIRRSGGGEKEGRISSPPRLAERQDVGASRTGGGGA